MGKAATEPPALCVLSHVPAEVSKTVCLVGKGIVYETAAGRGSRGGGSGMTRRPRPPLLSLIKGTTRAGSRSSRRRACAA